MGKFGEMLVLCGFILVRFIFMQNSLQKEKKSDNKTLGKSCLMSKSIGEIFFRFDTLTRKRGIYDILAAL